MGETLQKDEIESRADLVHQLLEALTATSNYLAAANRLFERQAGPGQETLGEALERGLVQCERASEAARHLRQLFSR